MWFPAYLGLLVVLSNEEIQLPEFLGGLSLDMALESPPLGVLGPSEVQASSFSFWVQGVEKRGRCQIWVPFPSPPSSFQQLKNKFIKKIPKDAEASNVLVGEVEFLEKPFVAFVRLLQATMLGGVTEVPVPTRSAQFLRVQSTKWSHGADAGGPRLPTRCLSLPRFLFILLGPAGKAKSYNEIGRAIATLMVDDVSRCHAWPSPLAQS